MSRKETLGLLKDVYRLYDRQPEHFGEGCGSFTNTQEACEAKDLWEVYVANQRPNDNGGEETYYSYLSHKGRSVWGERTAKKHAREFKANHLKDAWASPC